MQRAQTDAGWLPIHYAIAEGHTTVALMLLSVAPTAAVLETMDGHDTVVAMALKFGHNALAQRLQEALPQYLEFHGKNVVCATE